MNELLLPIFVILIVVVILMLIIKIAELSKKVKVEEEITNTSKIEYPYHRKHLISTNEYKFYKDLKQITDKHNLHILSKVRIEDIIEANDNLTYKEKQSARGRIKSRHFDFVLANPENLYVMCVIELDDKSHNNAKSKATDEFKNKICETVNLPIIRCTDINGVEDQICDKLKILKK